MDAPIIETRELTRRFDALVAVDRLNLSVSQGEIFGLVGPDGAGKTTTLRMLCGLMNPTSGSATVAGHDVEKHMELVKDEIGYMAQRFGLYQDLTVAENMQFYADLFGVTKAVRDELTPGLLRMTRMDPFQARQAGRLSGGMKQKLALMCTLLHRPKILFLDEPTNGVDPVSRREFWAILYQLVEDGVTVFVTTAYLDEAERCNRVGLMNRGKLIRCESPESLKNDMVETCYEVTAPDTRGLRANLHHDERVLSVEPFGVALHVFLKEGVAPELLRDPSIGSDYKIITPSVEDVFIAMIHKTEQEAGRVN
jgi:ABC-2 type transport system ATP-binding protein